MEHGGRVYPAAVEGGSPAQLVEAVEPARLDVDLLEAGRPHVEELTRRTPGLHDGPVLALDRLEGGVLHARPSSYLATLATADVLRAEWEEWEGQGVGPLRSRVHQLASPDPLRHGRGRAAAVGLAVVISFAGRVLLGRRAEALAADPGLWHVAPSGMLEPGVGVEDQIERELGEELGLDTDWSGRALGLGFDLLRLRPEVCWALEPLDEPELRLGDEFAEVCWIDPHGAWPEDLTPAAAAALALFSGTLPEGQ